MKSESPKQRGDGTRRRGMGGRANPLAALPISPRLCSVVPFPFSCLLVALSHLFNDLRAYRSHYLAIVVAGESVIEDIPTFFLVVGAYHVFVGYV